MARGRTFSREFKLAAVQDVVSGEKRPAQVCREHGLAAGLLLRWRREVAERGEAAFGPSEATSTLALERKVAELERFCGQLALENAALKKGLNMLPSRSGTR
ncbi:MAG: transposase [Chloroflexota bacterium]|jgi:transposase-like protein|nr:transposase [Chloroflexota bacterium]